MNCKFHVDTKVYRLEPYENYVRITGWCFDIENRNIEFFIKMNGEVVESEVKRNKRSDVEKKYQKKYNVPLKSGFNIKACWPKDNDALEKVELFVKCGEKIDKICSINKKEIDKIKDDSTIAYNLDYVRITDVKILIGGWTISDWGVDQLKISILNEKMEAAEDVKLARNDRKDLVEAGLVEEENSKCGFTIEFPYEEEKIYYLSIADKKKRKRIELKPEVIRRNNKVEARRGFAKQLVKCINKKNIEKGIKHIREHGVKGLKEYIVSRVNASAMPYGEWFELNKPTKKELEKQKKDKFEFEPKISIIVPTYKTPINFLREMIDSVIDQTYSNWELCIADGSEGDSAVEAELEKYAKQDDRIKYTLLEKNEGISGNTNAALKLETGEYVGLFDHDDILAPNALYEVVKALQEKEYDILYTDEDKITGDGKEHNDPNFKPDFSMDLFCSHNYITHFFVVKTNIIKKIGGFRPEYDGSQDYDLMFRCIESADSIKHIPMILYHWRIHMNSVAGDPASKMYAYDAGKRAIEDHFKRIGVKAKVEHTGLWGMYHVIYETPGNPLVSIIIPNKDHTDDLDKCVKSIINKSKYKNIEFIIIENNSTEDKTFAYYEKLQKEYENVKVVKWEEGFNYSAINNYGVSFAKGEYLLFLNNDTEMITPTAINELLGCCMREDVGVVGAKLLYSDDTVQHAGVVVGFGGYAGHVNMGIRRDDYGYMVRAQISCNYSAVTAACMITKKELFEQVGGFDEQFVVACNDVDYCLKVRETGKWVVFNAFSEWYHYESKSRGYEDTPEKLKRFEGEVAKFQKKWPEILEKGDPFYNPNFPIDKAPFTLG